MKNNKRLYWLSGITAAGLAGVFLVLVILVKHEPNFFRQSQMPPSEQRSKLAAQFKSKSAQMFFDIKGRTEIWGCVASEAEINAFLQEAFVHEGEAESLRKLGISEPSVTLEGNHMRMAFRYGKGWYSTIISYELRMWLATKEANVVAVQILSARAGALPISCQSILHQWMEFATKQNFKVTPYRHEGTPVAIISLQPEQPNSPTTLTVLDISNDHLIIQGRTLESEVRLGIMSNSIAPSGN